MDCDALTFEESFNLLEETVSRLEGGNLGLEEALALFERGMQLVTRCNALLDSAELRISQLVPSVVDEYETVPFGEA